MFHQSLFLTIDGRIIQRMCDLHTTSTRNRLKTLICCRLDQKIVDACARGIVQQRLHKYIMADWRLMQLHITEYRQDDDEESQLSSPQPYYQYHATPNVDDDESSQSYHDDDDVSLDMGSNFAWQQDDDEESQLCSILESHRSPIESVVSSISTFDMNDTPPPLVNINDTPPPIDIVHVETQQSWKKLIMFEKVTAVTPTCSDILFAGLFYAGFEPQRQRRNNLQRNTDRFEAFYGVEPSTILPILMDLKHYYPDITYKYCLICFNWLFCYETYPVLSGRWDYCEEKIGGIVIDYVKKLAHIGRLKIIFNLEVDIELGRTVDCVTFMAQEMRKDPSSKWFDYKT